MNSKLTYLSLGINALLAVAVGVLFYMHSKTCTVSTPENISDTLTSETIAPDALPTIVTNNGGIAFIDKTKLDGGYLLFKDAEAALKRENEKSQKDLDKRMVAWESNMKTYEQLAPSLPESTRAIREKELMKERDEILAFREKLEKDFADKYEAYNNRYIKSIDDYLKGLSKEKRYDYIFLYSKGEPTVIVYANDSLNITTSVVDALNKSYKKK
ncbi:MAG: OmpH family outer membrane protein [Cytophagaceae bacterium]